MKKQTKAPKVKISLFALNLVILQSYRKGYPSLCNVNAFPISRKPL